jgi:hypothetical protein
LNFTKKPVLDERMDDIKSIIIHKNIKNCIIAKKWYKNIFLAKGITKYIICKKIIKLGECEKLEKLTETLSKYLFLYACGIGMCNVVKKYVNIMHEGVLRKSIKLISDPKTFIIIIRALHIKKPCRSFLVRSVIFKKKYSVLRRVMKNPRKYENIYANGYRDLINNVFQTCFKCDDLFAFQLIYHTKYDMVLLGMCYDISNCYNICGFILNNINSEIIRGLLERLFRLEKSDINEKILRDIILRELRNTKILTDYEKIISNPTIQKLIAESEN